MTVCPHCIHTVILGLFLECKITSFIFTENVFKHNFHILENLFLQDEGVTKVEEEIQK